MTWLCVHIILINPCTDPKKNDADLYVSLFSSITLFMVWHYLWVVKFKPPAIVKGMVNVNKRWYGYLKAPCESSMSMLLLKTCFPYAEWHLSLLARKKVITMKLTPNIRLLKTFKKSKQEWSEPSKGEGFNYKKETDNYTDLSLELA